MLHKADQPFLTGVVVPYRARVSVMEADTKRIQRVVRATSWPEPVRDSEEVLLVDRVQQCDHRPLDDLVLQGRDRERALPAVRLGYVDPPRRQCPIRSPLDSLVQVLELALKVRLVVRPPQSIHARRGILLEFVERFFEQVEADVVEERGEPLLLPFPCGYPYAFQRLCHACPALCPVRALLVRIPLGLRPSLHRLRCGLPRHGSLRSRSHHFVRRFHSYYGEVRLLVSVRHRLRLLAFPMRTAVLDTHATAAARHEISQVPT